MTRFKVYFDFDTDSYNGCFACGYVGTIKLNTKCPQCEFPHRKYHDWEDEVEGLDND